MVILGYLQGDIKSFAMTLELYNCTNFSPTCSSVSHRNVERSSNFSPRPARPVALAQKVKSTLCRGQARIRRVDT